MKKIVTILLVFSCIGSGVILTGCDSSDPAIVTPPPPPPPQSPQSKFGAGFEAAFNKDKYDEPNPVNVGDIIDLDKTKEPLDISDPN